ncbi:MAG: AMP-binding protein [Bacteroidales bacterium]|nr:AMP-binding protein [Bacteroidales bacterium]
MILPETKTLAHLFEDCTSKYPDLTVNTMVGWTSGQTYQELKEKVGRLSILLDCYGVGSGDKVAILSAGHPNWIAAFFSATAFGRVAVPLLPDFSPSVVANVLAHSEAKALFVSAKCYEKLSAETLAALSLVIDIDTLEPIAGNKMVEGANSSVTGASAATVEAAGTSAKAEAAASAAETSAAAPDDLAVLIYTSGTTGNAKGVMLTHRNFMATLRTCYTIFVIGPEDSMLSALPLAHAYELSLGLLYPFSAGTCVYYLPKAPSPAVLTHALKVVRPTAMLVVPLIIEKVYRGAVLPRIRNSKALSLLDRICHPLLCRLVGKGMVRSFGGRIKFVGIGGAKLDVTVEQFLKTARFPYVIGYGLTECCPLLSIAFGGRVPKAGSIGLPVHGVSMRLDNVNPATGEGEIVATGGNIMKGYYKDPEKTASVFTADGWFRTGDLGAVDKKGNYYIKGRLGNMIVGPSGENIYPEDIEKVIMELPQVEECIVISRQGRLVALVKMHEEAVDIAHRDKPSVMEEVEKLRAQMLGYINSRVNASSRLSTLQFMTEPFDKTATLKIRRFVYASDAPAI